MSLQFYYPVSVYLNNSKCCNLPNDDMASSQKSLVSITVTHDTDASDDWENEGSGTLVESQPVQKLLNKSSELSEDECRSSSCGSDFDSSANEENDEVSFENYLKSHSSVTDLPKKRVHGRSVISRALVSKMKKNTQKDMEFVHTKARRTVSLNSAEQQRSFGMSKQLKIISNASNLCNILPSDIANRSKSLENRHRKASVWKSPPSPSGDASKINNRKRLFKSLTSLDKAMFSFNSENIRIDESNLPPSSPDLPRYRGSPVLKLFKSNRTSRKSKHNVAAVSGLKVSLKLAVKIYSICVFVIHRKIVFGFTSNNMQARSVVAIIAELSVLFTSTVAGQKFLLSVGSKNNAEATS